MNRFVCAALLSMAAMLPAAGAELGQLDASPTLFTVTAAINAAGYSADLSSPNNSPLRDAIRTELAQRDIPSLPALKDFFARHRKRNDVLELSQYISFALTTSGPPTFEIKLRDVDVPPDVTPMRELSPLLAAFYKEAGIENLWKRSRPAIDQYLELYHAPVSQAVLQVNAYLRQQTSGFKGRHFQILIELLAAPNQIQTRSYADDYTIVVTPSPEPRIFDIRHAYLHYLLDPLSTRYEEILDRKKPLADQAQRAPALDDSFKQDYLLLVTESLIKAIEAKLDRRPDGIQEAMRQGYILTPFFAEQLPIYEKQEQAMLYYYPTLVGAIDLRIEEARLSKVEFEKEPPARAAVATPAPPPPPAPTGAAKTLDEAEQLYTARDLDKAKKQYLDVLQQTDNQTMHAAAYYGLARIATLERDPELAERLFKRTLNLQPEAPVQAWSLVYLGRLSMAAGDRKQAAQYFQNALKVEGASPAAQQAASQGVESTSKP
ncbi:MAG TPA: tetratricopeptide repeat protein [Bryobacteraceae bacterium]|nr:tetratricopeptide repeat protein [Bryobacteraceae bacterium]